MNGKAEIIRILRERDGYTRKEATDLVDEVMDMMNEAMAAGDIEEAEEIFTSELGLEPDYLIGLLMEA